jgi:hypothetical protein
LLDITALSELEAQAFRYTPLTSAKHAYVTNKIVFYFILFDLVTVSLPAEKPRYAESWDFEVSGSSFLQFELSMGCSKVATSSHGVRLEYSTGNEL